MEFDPGVVQSEHSKSKHLPHQSKPAFMEVAPPTGRRCSSAVWQVDAGAKAFPAALGRASSHWVFAGNVKK